MRTRALPLFLLIACAPFEPPVADSTSTPAATSGETGAPGTGGWQIPPRDRGRDTAGVTSTSTSTTTTGAPPPSSSEASSDAPALTTGPGFDPSVLQIAELHPDPDGKDGGPDSPEFLELVHVGEAPVELAELEIDARAWPTLRGEKLGLAGFTLAPGERLLLLRYADAGDLPEPPVAAFAGGLRVAFASDEGLRNADGGVLVRTGDLAGDLVIHGASQPAPWDAGAWEGEPAPAPGSGQSLCRISEVDHDDKSDWTICTPSPGTAPELSILANNKQDTIATRKVAAQLRSPS